MRNRIAFLALLLSALAFGQRSDDQYSLEAGYGMGISGTPGITGFSHFDFGFRYMLDSFWGIKFDYGSDRFRTYDNPEKGTDYSRYSMQVVHNLGRTLNVRWLKNNGIGLLVHGGLGYSSLESITKKGVDNIGNVIIGVKPQMQLIDNLALHIDLSYILNFTQHYNFDGEHPYDANGGPPDPFTGTLFNTSIGLTYYFGKNGSKSDWR